MADVILALGARFPGAMITESVKPADWTGEEVHWARVLATSPRRTVFVGVSREALDHPQDLVRQLNEYFELIAPEGAATLILKDHSDNSRYRL